MNELERELLPQYVLGALTGAERAQVERALAADPELAALCASMADGVTLLAAALPDEAAPSAVRSRLLETLESPRRFFDFVPDLAKHFDLAVDTVTRLIENMSDPSVWEAGPMPGIFVMHFPGGPNAVGADTGFVQLPAGLAFPYHRHAGTEINYVMEGTVRDGDGTLYFPGQAIVKSAASEHEFSVGPECNALIAVIQTTFEIVPKP